MRQTFIDRCRTFLRERRHNSLGRRLTRIERLAMAGRAVYLGNDRLLVSARIGNRPFAFIMQASDRLIMPMFVATGVYDEAATRFLLSTAQPTDHCVDVGANFGYYSCLMASLSPEGRVFGFEPDPDIHALARDNLDTNGLHLAAEVVNAAISDTDGEITLYKRIGRSGNTSIVEAGQDLTNRFGEPPVRAFQARTLRIDGLLERLAGRLDIMKIDVEGAEPLVLSGAREAIRLNPRIKIIMEWSPGQIQTAGFDIAGFTADIQAMGLQAYDITVKRPTVIGFDALRQLPYVSNILLCRSPA